MNIRLGASMNIRLGARESAGVQASVYLGAGFRVKVRLRNIFSY